MEDNNFNAFVFALSLAITAPSEKYSQHCLSIAQDFSLPLDEIQFAKAKRLVAKANKEGTLEVLITEKGKIVGDLIQQHKGGQNA